MDKKLLPFDRDKNNNPDRIREEALVAPTIDRTLATYPLHDGHCCDDEPCEFDDTLSQLIERMQGNKSPLMLKIPGKVDPKYYLKQRLKDIDLGRSVPVPPSFDKVSVITDQQMSEGYVILTENRASRIFYAIASAIFYAADSLFASQAKLMFLRQIERDYVVAKKAGDRAEIRRCIRLVNKTVLDHDEPWYDEEWLIASKAYFAPIHVLFNCSRVPMNPHALRYQFSPVVCPEKPIKIVVHNGD